MIRRNEWETYEQMILSDQIPADQLARLMADNPDFAAWLKERAKQRQGGR